MKNALESSTDPRWRRLPEERPGQILHAALMVFSESGISAAKLEDIAVRAGVSKGTIYLYFESKEELFREVVRLMVVPQLAEADSLGASADAGEQIKLYLEHHWHFMDREEADGWIRLALLELHKFPDLAECYRKEVIAPSNRALAAIIQRGIDAGEFRPVEPDAAVRMIKSILLMHVLWSGPRSLNPVMRGRTRADTLNEITDFIIHALRSGTGLPVSAAAGA